MGSGLGTPVARLLTAHCAARWMPTGEHSATGCGTGWAGGPLSPLPTLTCCCGAMGGSCGHVLVTPSQTFSTGGTCPSLRWV